MKGKLPTALMLGLLAGSSVWIARAQSPKIVVGIMVDQLRTDYLEQLRPYFGSNGFNRLINEGVYIPDVDFRNSVSDGVAGTAVVYTGAWPMVNGVAAAETFDPAQHRSVPALAEGSTLSRTEYSPAGIRVSTLADELAVNGGRLAKIYSVAGDARMAVISSGHAGDAAVWFDETSAKWNSPAYYGTLPPVVSNRNRISPLSSKITATSWRPLNPANFYDNGKTWADGDFSYTFSGGNRDTYTRFKESAPFNSEVTDLAIEFLKSMQSGQSGMLNVGYTLAPISFDYDGDNRAELVDSYVRLDTELGRLLDSIDKEYGKGNALVFLSSTGHVTEPSVPEGDVRIPSGEITLKQAESLLNSYLSATYGNADYVSLIRNGKLYLNAKEIEGKKLDIKTIRKEAKDFLMRMGGISEAVTVDEVLHSEGKRGMDLRLGVDPKNSPDLFLFFMPGWTVTDDNVYPAVSKKVRLASPPVPAFLLAPGLEAQKVEKPVEATVLAPTVSTLMRIRAPNAAASRPLSLRGSKN